MFVTTFYRPPNTLSVDVGAESFHDATRQAGLFEPGLLKLGFGTQFLDANLDGHLDLFVANGHIDDYQRYGRPYRMPALCFANTGQSRFVEVSADVLGPYFHQKVLGRGASRLDWNRDGLPDVVVSHLDAPVALLTNTSASFGRFISLRLHGVQSSRDAIGATVTAVSNGRSITRQLTAGDGYQASNERVLIIGTGIVSQESTVQLSIHWPSGLKQSFVGLQVDREYALVEGAAAPTCLIRAVGSDQ